MTKTSPTICGAKKRDGEACRARPIKGGTRCKNHGGSSPQAKRAAERRLAEQELLNVVQTLGIREHYPDIDPGAALLEEIRIAHAHVRWLRGKVAELSPEDLTWGLTEHKEGLGVEGPVDVRTEAAKPSIWYELYSKEREYLVKISAAALKAGIEERKIRMAEHQGVAVAGVIKKVLDGLGLTSAQAELIPILVPNALRELTGELA